MAAYYGKRLPQIAKMLVAYKENVTAVREPRGNENELTVMAALTGSHFLRDGMAGQYRRYDERMAEFDNQITGLYQKTGYPIFFGALAGILLLIGTTFSRIFRKQASGRDVSVLLVTLGMVGSCLALVFAVMWFCCFLYDRRVYDYLCAVVPLMETLEMIGLYYLYRYVRSLVQKVRIEK